MSELKTKENDHSVIDIDVNVLKALINQSVAFLQEMYPNQ
jgi:hypothetical protein